MRAIDLSPPILATIDESALLLDAAKMMREQGVGDILITRKRGKEDKPVGLITDRDIVVHAIACDLDPGELKVADLVTRDPVTVDADAGLAEITAAMKENGVRRVLVKWEGDIAGVVTLDDVLTAMAELLDDISDMLTGQLDYEAEHIESQGSAA